LDIQKDLLINLETLISSLSFISGNLPGNFNQAVSEVIRELEKKKLLKLYFLLENLERPVNVILAGGTGVGKSTIFNTLLGKNVSKVSRKRATTFHPVVSYHPTKERFFFSSNFMPDFSHTLDNLPQEKETSKRMFHVPENGLYKDISFMDIPDFDSVFENNAKIASDLFDIADVVLFVFDTVKYKDKILWEKGVKVIARHNTNIIFILNKISDDKREDGVAGDFEKTKEVFGFESSKSLFIGEAFPDKRFPNKLSVECKNELMENLDEFICSSKLRSTKIRSSYALYKFLARETIQAVEEVKKEIVSRCEIIQKVDRCYGERLQRALRKIDENRHMDNKEVVKIVRTHLGSIVGLIHRQMLSGAKKVYGKVITFLTDGETEFSEERKSARSLLSEKQSENLELLFQLFFEIEKELDPLFREKKLSLPQNREDFFNTLRSLFQREEENIQKDLKDLIIEKKKGLNWKGKILLNSLDGIVLVFMLLVSYFYVGGIGVSAGEYIGTGISTVLGDHFFSFILGKRELDEIFAWLEKRHRGIYEHIFQVEKDRIINILLPPEKSDKVKDAINTVQDIIPILGNAFSMLGKEIDSES